MDPYYKMLLKVQREITPKEESFTDIYSKKEIELDKTILEANKKNPEYRQIDEREDAKVLEKVFIDMVETDDWFREFDLYGEDDEWHSISTIPANEIDDSFNHIDMIGVISNEATDHKPLPFAIDLTYNSQPESIAKKFHWKHVYSKSDAASDDVSEFGKLMPDGGTRPLSLEKRKGLKIPGFAQAKYFEDMNSGDSIIKKGRISLMPRFIVGFDPEVADILSHGKPNETEIVIKYDRNEFEKRDREYQKARYRAQWCALLELTKQSEYLNDYLEKLPDNEKSQMDASELALAKQYASRIKKYFDNAFELARKEAEKDQLFMEAAVSATRDVVLNAIVDQSAITYKHNNPTGE